MAKKHLPDIETLRQLLRYDPEAGKLYWLDRQNNKSFNTRFSGKEAGTAKDRYGYLQIEIININTRSHIIAWALHYGLYPSDELDHINGDRADNRIVNLREATRSQNNMNTALAKNNTSGAKGVHFFKVTNKWSSFIKINRKSIHLGYFLTFEEAVDARKKAEIRYHGEYARKSQ
jgi:hypothetical protein